MRAEHAEDQWGAEDGRRPPQPQRGDLGVEAAAQRRRRLGEVETGGIERPAQMGDERAPERDGPLAHPPSARLPRDRGGIVDESYVAASGQARLSSISMKTNSNAFT